MTRYRQLTLQDRYQIQAFLKLRMGKAAIAATLGRHPSTIFREIRRNRNDSGGPLYIADRASRKARDRRILKSAASRKIRGPLKELVEAKLRLGWSPEQISGRLRKENRGHISHETIYQHVLRDRSGLRYCLRFGGYKHHRFKKSKAAIRTAMWKKLLSQRPAAANERTQVGHWERDLVVGDQGGACILTIVDRRTRFTRMRRVSGRSSNEVATQTKNALLPFGSLNRTLTNDNGVEFGNGQALEKQLGIPIFYTDPGAPWQRGSVENTNGLIRQYIRKGTSLEDYHPRAAEAVEETLNYRPRKVLGFKTPHESFFGERLNLMNSQSQFGLKFSCAS